MSRFLTSRHLASRSGTYPNPTSEYSSGSFPSIPLTLYQLTSLEMNRVHLLAQPGPIHSRGKTPTSNVLLSWRHSRHCVKDTCLAVKYDVSFLSSENAAGMIREVTADVPSPTRPATSHTQALANDYLTDHVHRRPSAPLR